jgi:hypothetical protein
MYRQPEHSTADGDVRQAVTRRRLRRSSGARRGARGVEDAVDGGARAADVVVPLRERALARVEEQEVVDLRACACFTRCMPSFLQSGNLEGLSMSTDSRGVRGSPP